MKIVIKKPLARPAAPLRPSVSPVKAPAARVPSKLPARPAPAPAPKPPARPAAPVATVKMEPSKPAPSLIAAPDRQAKFLAAFCGRLGDPMEILSDSIDTLLSEIPEESRTESLYSAYESFQAVRNMLDDIRDFAQLQTKSLTLQASPMDCDELLAEVREAYLPYAEAKGVSLVVEIDRMPVLEMDVLRFRKIVTGLVENAVRFTDQGTVGVSMSHFGGKLKLTVEDTGCGMTPEQVAEIFNPYARLESDVLGAGPGLGMALIRGIVDLMGGTVEVNSAPGIGTSIVVTIPNVRAARASEMRGFTSQRIQAIKMSAQTQPDARILVVDDSPVNLAFMQGMFRAMEFTHVEVVSSGIEALQKVLAGEVDIVFTDVLMPGMDGTDLVREIRKVPAYEKLPVYAVTADNEAREGCAEAGFTDVILKPMTRDKIRRLIG